MIKFKCSSCGFEKDIADQYAGKKVLCPKCKASNLISSQQSSQPQKPVNLIKFNCPLCHKKMGVPTEFAGRRVKCTGCSHTFAVPAPLQPQVDSATKPPQDNVFANAQDLLNMEMQAKAVDMPELTKMPAAPAAEELKDEKSGYDRPEIKKRKEDRDGLDLPVVSLIVITVIIVLGFLLINWRVGTAENEPAVAKEQVVQAERFAASFLNLLAKGEVNDVSLMLSKELRTEDVNSKLEPFTEALSKVWNDNFKATSLSAQEETGNVYLFVYKPGAGDRGLESITVVISEDFRGLVIEGINYQTAGKKLLRIESRQCYLITKTLNESLVGKIIGFFKKYLLFTAILFAISRLSKAVVFYRAGESAFAAIIPCWYEWTLAEVGDKSGVWGAVAFAINGAPVIGQLIYTTLILYFSIGIAETHGRGVLFGIGLCFLPFIFYPVLVFSRD